MSREGGTLVGLLPTQPPAGKLAVYLVPHSLRGSQLDYGRVEAESAAKDAITSGR